MIRRWWREARRARDGWSAARQSNFPRRSGQLHNLAPPDNFDDPLHETEIAAWEGGLYFRPQSDQSADESAGLVAVSPGVASI